MEVTTIPVSEVCLNSGMFGSLVVWYRWYLSISCQRIFSGRGWGSTWLVGFIAFKRYWWCLGVLMMRHSSSIAWKGLCVAGSSDNSDSLCNTFRLCIQAVGTSIEQRNSHGHQKMNMLLRNHANESPQINGGGIRWISDQVSPKLNERMCECF
jgi:hypothetical protein